MPNHDCFQIKQVRISNIFLDLSNPRIRLYQAADQEKALQALTAKKGEQLYALAKDICEKGLGINPIVITRAPEEGKYIVMDGNRRIAALKLLVKPDGLKYPLKQKFEKLAKEYGLSAVPDPIECLYSENIQAIIDHIERNHTGTGQGEGQLAWSALEQAFFELDHEIKGQYDRAAKLLRMAERLGIVFSDEFPITTLNRLISEEMLTRIGIVELNRDSHELCDDEAIVAERLAEIIGKINSGELHVKRTGEPGSIFKPEEQRAYIDDLMRRFPKAITRSSSDSTRSRKPSTPATANDSTATPVPAEPASPSSEDSDTSLTSSRSTATTPRKKTAERKKVVQNRAQKIRIDKSAPAKVRDIYTELQRLKSEDTPIAAALLIRSLLELAVEQHVKKHMLDREVEEIRRQEGGGGKPGLRHKMLACIGKLRSSKDLSEKEVKVLKLIAGKDTYLSVDTLNQIVHNPHFPTDSVLVNQMWDKLKEFIELCLNQ